MKTVNFEQVGTTKNPHGVDARKLYESENVQVVHILLKAGESLVKHATQVDVLFYILEGEGIVEIGDEKQLVTKNMLIESPKNIPHCLSNEGTADFRVLVVKTPGPTAAQNKQAIQDIINSK